MTIVGLDDQIWYAVIGEHLDSLHRSVGTDRLSFRWWI